MISFMVQILSSVRMAVSILIFEKIFPIQPEKDSDF